MLFDVCAPDIDGSAASECGGWNHVGGLLDLEEVSERSAQAADKIRFREIKMLKKIYDDELAIYGFFDAIDIARFKYEMPRRVSTFSCDHLQIDFEARRVLAGGKDVRLTRTEFELLRLLVSEAGKPLTHTILEQILWGSNAVKNRACLRVYVNQLRKKIEPDPLHPTHIVTDHWVGYRFTASNG